MNTLNPTNTREAEPMDFYDVVRNRYSVRAYQPEAVPDDKLQRILDAAVLAPTAANRQSFRLVVIHTKGREAELGRIYGRPWFTEAPLVIAAVGISDTCWVRGDGYSFRDTDVSIVMAHVVMAAAAEGLGTCWIGAFDAKVAREILVLPANAEALAFTPLGFPADAPKAKVRKPKEQLVSYDKF
jgi:nitroreductase